MIDEKGDAIMKIYNKKTFYFGVFSLLLGIFNLILDILNKSFDTKGNILITALIFIGTGFIIRGITRKFAKEDKLEEKDERNQLINLKSKSKAFSVTQLLSFLLMIIIFVCGKVSGNEEFIAIGVGIAFVLSISMFSELFFYFHYENRN